MSDHGQKIIQLASEILCQEKNLASNEQHCDSPQITTLSMKTVCLAAFAAAFGTLTVGAHVYEGIKPITHYQRVEIEALVFYVAKERKLTQESLQRELQAALNLPSLQHLTSYDFNRIREFLLEKLDD